MLISTVHFFSSDFKVLSSYILLKGFAVSCWSSKEIDMRNF